jgi:sulfur relay protein TusB/DsrH
MLLHTVNKSPFERNSLESCLRLSKAGHAILLFEDGVYAALQGTRWATAMTDALQDLRDDFRFRSTGNALRERDCRNPAHRLQRFCGFGCRSQSNAGLAIVNSSGI